MDDIETIRKLGLISGEKRYYALEALRAITEWFQKTMPSELMTYEEGSGKTFERRAAVEEPKMRELWQKWGDAVTKTVFDKASQIPELLIDDVINLFKEAKEKDAETV